MSTQIYVLCAFRCVCHGVWERVSSCSFTWEEALANSSHSQHSLRHKDSRHAIITQKYTMHVIPPLLISLAHLALTQSISSSLSSLSLHLSTAQTHQIHHHRYTSECRFMSTSIRAIVWLLALLDTQTHTSWARYQHHMTQSKSWHTDIGQHLNWHTVTWHESGQLDWLGLRARWCEMARHDLTYWSMSLIRHGSVRSIATC
jgi:hypothetical protein